jgi:tetratricopeptide (TPR) repeat protein
LSYRFYGVRTGRRQDFEQSDKAFCRALACRPHFYAARFQRGLLYWRELRAPALAVQDFSAVLAATNAYPDALFLRAMAYHQQGDYHNAASDLRLYVALYPYSHWADNARHQLTLLDAILSEMKPQLAAHTDRLSSTSSDS